MSPTDGSCATDDEAGPPRARKAGHAGVTIRLADGHEWTMPLSRQGARVREARDRIADAAYGGPFVTRELVFEAAYYLLSVAYDEPPERIGAALGGTEPRAILDSLAEAMLIPEVADDAVERTYSDWIAGGLAANGLVGDRRPTDEALPHVVKHLVGTGRMLPVSKFVNAAIVTSYRGNVLRELEAD